MTQILNALDVLGYNKTEVTKRTEVYKEASKSGTYTCRKKTGENVTFKIVGSRGEGLGLYFDVDTDKLIVQNSVICYQNGTNIDKDNYFATFITESEGVPNGYTRLRLESLNGNVGGGIMFNKNLVTNLMVDDHNGHIYLENDNTFSKTFSKETLWHRRGWMTVNTKFSEKKKGPSKPYTMKIPYTNVHLCFDDTIAFRCICPEIVNNWVGRERQHDWPTEDVINKIRNLHGYVVPVGSQKQAEGTILQWRICLTDAETELVHTFNDTQIKLYAALKMLFKCELGSISSKMSSYVAKNVMFWLSERNGYDAFKSEYFENRFSDALDMLLSFLEENNIPNYMIPDRNIIDCLTEPTRKKLISHICKLRQEGINVLLRCPEVKMILNSTNTRIDEIKQQREIREQVVLSIYLYISDEDRIKNLIEINEAETMDGLLEALTRIAFAKVREHDPLQFFNHIRNMTDNEILRKFYEGIIPWYYSCYFCCNPPIWAKL